MWKLLYICGANWHLDCQLSISFTENTYFMVPCVFTLPLMTDVLIANRWLFLLQNFFSSVFKNFITLIYVCILTVTYSFQRCIHDLELGKKIILRLSKSSQSLLQSPTYTKWKFVAKTLLQNIYMFVTWALSQNWSLHKLY